MKSEASHTGAIFLDASGTLLRGAYSHPLGVEVYADAAPILDSFRARSLSGRKIRTGIITNWGRKIDRIVEALNLQDCFDVIVSADDCSDGKPSSAMFHLACQLAQVSPRNSFHIGDSLFDDALGAQSAGLQSIWINRYARVQLGTYEREQIKTLKHPPCHNLQDAFKYLQTLLSSQAHPTEGEP